MRYRRLLQAGFNCEMSSISPVSAWQHKPLLDQDSVAFAEATIAEQQKFDFDFIKLTPASTWQSIDFGLKDSWQNDYLGRRTIAQHNITRPEDFEKLTLRNPWQGFTGKILTAARLTRAGLPPQVPLLATVFNPFFQLAQQCGLPFLLKTAKNTPQLFEGAIQQVTENTLRLIAELIDLGIEGIFYVSQHASNTVLSAECYQQLALASDKRCIETVATLPFSMLHLHGSDTHWHLFTSSPIPLHIDSLAVDKLSMLSPYFSALAGAIPVEPLFLQGAVSDISNEVHAKRQRFAGKGYIVTPGCALPLAVPEANIFAMVQAARTPIFFNKAN